MKKFKVLSLMLATLLMFGLLAACGGGDAPAAPASSLPQSTADESTPAEPESTPAAGAISFTDMMGRQITLDGPAQKVVALTAADCEIIYALGAGATVVGRGEYCNYPEEVLEVEAVQSGNDTNVEQIIALAPDVLFMSSMAQTEEQIAQLEGAGIAVVVNEAFTLEEVYQSIKMFGTALGLNDAAEALVADMQAGFQAVADKAAEKIAAGDGAEQSIYYEVSPLEFGLWTSCSGTFMDEIGTMLGLRNIFSDLEAAHGTPYTEVSEEQVIERNPDYIVTITMYFGEGPTPDEEILSRAGWQGVTAVANGKVLVLNNDELSRPGPRLAEAASALYDFVYG